MDRAHSITDYGPNNFHPFGFLPKHVIGKRLATEADVKQATTSQLPVLDIDFFYPQLQSLVPRGGQILKYE
jgi:hypothetical protein